MSEKVLVAYDGSLVSKKAIREAQIQLSGPTGKELHIISVITKGISKNHSGSQMDLAEDFKRLLKNLAEEYEIDKFSVTTDVSIDYSDRNAGYQICEYAKDHGIDLIIVGNRGLEGIKKVFLGSVSENVIQHSPCPVIIMK